jgi:hypothetical protein
MVVQEDQLHNITIAQCVESPHRTGEQETISSLKKAIPWEREDEKGTGRAAAGD